MPDITSSLMAANPAASIPGAAIGLAQTVTSLINAGKAKKEAKVLARSRPKRETSPLYGQNLSLAESELAGGMSTAAERAYNNQLEKATSASLSAILRGGGSGNNVADVFAGGEEGRQRLAMLNDQLRLKQIDNVVKARNMSADEADKNFIFNDWMPWSDSAAANAQARKDANAGIWSGLSTMVGAGTNMLSNKGGGAGGAGAGGFGQVASGAMAGMLEGGMGRVGQPPASVSDFNFNPSTESINFETPDYLTDPNWWQGAHNMY